MSDSEKQIMQDLYVYHSNVYMTQRNEIMYGGMERPKESGGRKEEKIKGKWKTKYHLLYLRYEIWTWH